MHFLRLLLFVLGLNLIALVLADEDRLAGPGMTAWADDDDGDDDDDDDDRPVRHPREVVAAGLTRAQLATLQRRGYTVVGERGNVLLGRAVWLLRAPQRHPRDPLAEVRSLGRNVLADRNNLYQPNQGSGDAARTALRLADWPASAQRCRVSVPIGMIDTAIDLEHPALRGASVHVLTLPGRDAQADSTTAHGTAVAALLVGQDEALPALLPHARLLAVDGFRTGPRGAQRMQAWDLLAALSLLSDAGARVINMSFAGAANALLAQALERAHERGVVTVAAVGNRGPRAAPQYPAAYPGVIAVTAIDTDRRVYARAGRGAHVDFSAPGVALPTAGARGDSGLRSGTSFAAPFVAAAAAVVQSQRPRPRSVGEVEQRLAEHARDLGAPGRDPVYGHGLVQTAALCGR